MKIKERIKPIRRELDRVFKGDWYEVSLKLLLTVGVVTGAGLGGILHHFGIGLEALSELSKDGAEMAKEKINHINTADETESVVDVVSESRGDGDEATVQID